MKKRVKSKKFFAYVRVSNDDYAASNQNQMDIIIETANRKNIEKKNIEFIEEQKSWKNESERKKFNEMIDILKKDYNAYKNKLDQREYGGIIFFKIDRLARNDKDFNILFDLLDCWYIFLSATETIENTPTWRLLFRMLCSFAVYESEKLSSRISIARIHNIQKEKFLSLWWTSLIFWYEKKEIKQNGEIIDKRIVVNEVEKKIIKSIYEIYSYKYRDTINWEDQTINTYQDIFDALGEDQQQYIKNCKKTVSNVPDFVRNILNNDNMLRYNGEIHLKQNINDEHIQKYLNNMLNNTEYVNTFKHNGACEIWWKIELIFFLKDLMIIPPSFQKIVQKKLNTSRAKKEVRDKSELNFNGIFEGLIYSKWLWVEYSTNVEYKKTKNYYWYKIDIEDVNGNKKGISLSEKKVENIIKTGNIVDLFSKIDDNLLLQLIEIIESTINVETNIGLRTYVAENNLYKHWQKEYERKADNAQTLSKKEEYLIVSDGYLKKIKTLEKIIEEEKSWVKEQIQIYLELFKLDDFYSQSDFIRRRFYIAFLDRIVYQKFNDDWIEIPIIVEVYFKSFLVKLWLPPMVKIIANS